MAMNTVYADSEPKRAEVDALAGPALLEFGNSWCGYCRAAQPLIASALREHPHIRHLKIADASGRRLGRSFRVKLWPTLIFLKDGKEIARLVRPQDEATVRKALARIDGEPVSPRLLVFAAILVLVASAPEARAQASGGPTYADLAPILAARCVMCHSGENAPLGLRLDSVEGLLKGSANGPVVKAADPAASELIGRLKGTRQPRMPMTGPPFLSESEIALFERWVAGGLQRGAAAAAKAPAKKPAPARPAPGERLTYAHVAPILATRCAKCHTDKGLMGSAPEGYRLTSYEATLATTGRVRVVPGKPDASELVRRIRGQARPRMPFDGPPYLAREEIRLIEDWIKQGARNAEGKAAPAPTGARVRLHGTLTSRWRLDGLPLTVGARTRIDRDPAPGDYVEVRGRLRPDAGVELERLRRR